MSKKLVAHIWFCNGRFFAQVFGKSTIKDWTVESTQAACESWAIRKGYMVKIESDNFPE